MGISRIGQSAMLASAAVVLVATLAVQATSQPVHAATDIQSLLAQAEHNTNSVRTLVHHDQTTISSTSATLTASTVGSEDEVRNREHDFESVTIAGNGTGSAGKSQHYTLDIIFINGTTYYRSTLVQSNKWLSRKGTSLQDPYTGTFKRARTTVTFPKSYVFKQVGTSGGQTQIRASFSNAKSAIAGSVDLWISGGSTPYVMRELQVYHSTKKGTSGQGRVDSRFGPYNGPLVILAPTSSGTT